VAAEAVVIADEVVEIVGGAAETVAEVVEIVAEVAEMVAEVEVIMVAVAAAMLDAAISRTGVIVVVAVAAVSPYLSADHQAVASREVDHRQLLLVSTCKSHLCLVPMCHGSLAYAVRLLIY
jgi:hypothetical protein